MELSQVTSPGQSSIFYSKDDLILGPASLKGSTGGLFPRAWIIFYCPIFSTGSKKQTSPRGDSSFHDLESILHLYFLSCIMNLTSDLAYLPLSTPISFSLSSFGLSHFSSNLPLPHPSLIYLQTPLVLFLAPAFSFLNMEMSS